jgi:hypothetical protein
MAIVWREPNEIAAEVRHRLPPGVEAWVNYRLNSDLTLRAMTVGGSFERAHDELHATDVLKHAFSTTEAAALREIAPFMTAVSYKVTPTRWP